MSASKVILTFVSGIAAGVAISYFADPKGTEKRFKVFKKDFDKRAKKLENNISGKLEGYKKTYNEMVDKYANNGKQAIEKSKSSVQLK